MAKRRMLSQEIIYDEEFNSLSIEAQNLFIRMLTVSDDFGIIPANDYTLTTLTNPPKKVVKYLANYLYEITIKGMGIMFVYDDKRYFMFKRTSFDRINSYVIGKRTKSEFLKLDAEFIESDKFQEILGNYREDVPTSIISIKKKVESKEIKEEPGNSHILQKFILENCPNISLLTNQLTQKEAEKLFAEYTETELQSVIEGMENYKPLNKKYKSVNLTMQNWLRRDRENGTNHKKSPRGTIDFSKWESEHKIARGEMSDMVSSSIQ